MKHFSNQISLKIETYIVRSISYLYLRRGIVSSGRRARTKAGGVNFHIIILLPPSPIFLLLPLKYSLFQAILVKKNRRA
jgi:hypothetical protein